jgi:DNA-binding response OmpR family regulator
MRSKILVVEDEIFVAVEVEAMILDMGHTAIGIASDSGAALRMGRGADIALVDLNLVDGPTGLDVGRTLAERGVTVLYMTANPSQLGGGVPGTIGVLPKPVDGEELKEAINFAVSVRQRRAARPPDQLRLFEDDPAFGALAASRSG